MNYLMGIDISTTGSKALIIDTHGNVIAAHTSPHSLSNPRPLWSEQDPEEWWKAACTSIRTVITHSKIHPETIAAIGLTGQMHGLVLLDEHGKPIQLAV